MSGSVPASLFLVHVLVFGSLGVVLLIGSVRSEAALYLGAFDLLVASAFGDRLVGALVPFLPNGVQAPALVLRVLRPDVFAVTMLWSFVSVFPRLPAFVWAQRVPERSSAITAALAVLLAAGDAAVAWVPGWVTPEIRWLFDSRSTGTSLYWAAALLPGAPALPLLWAKVRFAEPDARRRLRLLAASIVSGLLPLLVLGTWRVVSPTFKAYSQTHVLASGAMVYVGLLSIPVTTGYAVLVQRALDVRFVLRVAVRHLLADQTLRVLTIAPMVGLTVCAFLNRHRPVGDLVVQPAVLVLTGLVLALILFGQGRHRLSAWVDVLIFRERHDPAEMLGRVADGIRSACTKRDVATLLVEEIDRAVHPATLALLVRTSAGAFVPHAGGGRPLGASTAIAAILQASPAPLCCELSRHSLAGLLPSPEIVWIADAAAEWLVPLHGPDGMLVAVLAVGAKRGGAPFDAEEMRVLQAAAAMAATVLHHMGARDAHTNADDGISDCEAFALDCVRCGATLSERVSCCHCGGALIASALPLVTLGKFRLQRRLGAGGMGVVYRAEDLALGRVVALKTLPRVVPRATVRMRGEGRAMAMVQHANLAQIFGVESWRGVPILVVEYLEGGTLSQRLDDGPMSPAAVVNLGVHLADALSHMHRVGVLHRDIKPSNIGFSAAGAPKLLDFGLARLVANAGLLEGPAPTGAAPPETHIRTPLSGRLGETTSRRLVGTPSYLSPEALAGGEPAPSFDLWSLAVVLYEALTGANPFHARSLAGTVDRIEHASSVLSRHLDQRPALGPQGTRIVNMLASALHPDPARRPPSAAAFRACLDEAGRMA